MSVVVFILMDVMETVVLLVVGIVVQCYLMTVLEHVMDQQHFGLLSVHNSQIVSNVQ